MKKSKEIKLGLNKEKISELNKLTKENAKGGFTTGWTWIICMTYPSCFCPTGPTKCR